MYTVTVRPLFSQVVLAVAHQCSGVILWELLTHEMPFGDVDAFQVQPFLSFFSIQRMMSCRVSCVHEEDDTSLSRVFDNLGALGCIERGQTSNTQVCTQGNSNASKG